jgi:hypothetical protein
MRRKTDPFLRDPDERGEAVDLESAAVGQDGLRPGDEGVEPAHGLDRFDARPEGEMVGVEEEDLGAQALDERVGHGLDRPLAGHGHEGRGFDGPVSRLEDAGAGGGGGVLGGYPESMAHWEKRK